MARGSKRSTARSGRSRATWGGMLLWTLTRIALPLAIIYGLIWWRIDAMIERQVAQVRQFMDINRGASFFTLDGDVGVKNLRVAPSPEAQPTLILRAERVTVHTPGLWWMLKASLFGAPQEIPSRLGLSFGNLEVDGAAADPEDGLIGAYSGIPFEAAGCLENAFGRAELQAMGLNPGRTVLQAVMEQAGPGVLSFTAGSETPGVGSLDARFSLNVPGGARMRPEALLSATLGTASVAFRDEGFIAARNRHCASAQSLTEPEFMQQHIEATEALLMTQGLRADPGLLEAYRHFALNGGELVIETRPQGNLGFAQMGMMSPDNLLLALSPYVRVTGVEPARFAFDIVRPRSLAEQRRDAEVAAARVADGLPPPEPEVIASSSLVAADEAMQPDVDGRLAYEGLAEQIGRQISVSTTHSTVRRGELLAYSRVRIVVRLVPEQGGFELTIPADTIRDIRLLDRSGPENPATGSPAVPPTEAEDAEEN